VANDSAIVLTRAGKSLVVVALALTIGLHWMALQTVAWTAMLTHNLRSDSLAEAWTKTFDGKHPCCLCKAVAAGKKSEKKSELSSVPKLEFPPAAGAFALIAPPPFPLLPPANSSPATWEQKPPTPPPRRFGA
jgi:hypothetical protein